MPNECSFPINILWLIKSNALLKSSSITLTNTFNLSVASYQMLAISTSASVVDVPVIPSNCLSSISLSRESSTHLTTIDSNTFAAIGVSEIGLKSFYIETGRCTLGTGTTYADFHCGGKIPSRNELLKIAVSGAARTSVLLRITHAGISSGAGIMKPCALLKLDFLTSAYKKCMR